MSKLTKLIEAQGRYCKVQVDGPGLTGMLLSEDHPYNFDTDTGGRRLIGYKSELEAEYGIDPEESKAAAILGRKGGAAKSPTKTTAVRENGKKGGRPKLAKYDIADDPRR
jgi:hypothetical protein